MWRARALRLLVAGVALLCGLLVGWLAGGSVGRSADCLTGWPTKACVMTRRSGARGRACVRSRSPCSASTDAAGGPTGD